MSHYYTCWRGGTLHVHSAFYPTSLGRVWHKHLKSILFHSTFLPNMSRAGHIVRKRCTIQLLFIPHFALVTSGKTMWWICKSAAFDSWNSLPWWLQRPCRRYLMKVFDGIQRNDYGEGVDYLISSMLGWLPYSHSQMRMFSFLASDSVRRTPLSYKCTPRI